MGGRGDNGDWRADAYDHVYALAWHQNRRYAYSMAHFRGDLILGVKGYEGTGYFWRCRR